MRLVIPDLLPGQQYAIEVRANDGVDSSPWSPIFKVTTMEDTVLPQAPTNVTWVVTGDSFYGEWDSIELNANSDYSLVTRYEVELTGNSVTKIVTVPQQTGSRVNYTLNFEANRALFGSPAATVAMRVRAVDNKGIKSNWSATKSATNPAPSPVTNLSAAAITDGVNLNWTNPTDNDLVGANVYASTTSNFTPSAANKVGFTAGTQFGHSTSNYTTWHYVVRAVDKFGSESSIVRISQTPYSPFTADVDAPAVPTGLAATIVNSADGRNATANISWTMTNPPSDLSSFNVRWREVGGNWNQTTVDRDSRELSIPLSKAYVNHEFQIRAYDFSANYSDWSAIATGIAPGNTAPAQTTGVVVASGVDSLNISWTESTEADVKAGAGTYDVQIAENSAFTTNLLTYKTGGTSLAVSGLKTNTTYYVRVRATDSGGLSGSYSTTVSKQTGAFPVTPKTDGFPPSSSPTPTVTPDLGSLMVRWSPVTTNSQGGSQEDLVTYEVHISATNGFTASATTKVTEVAGTSAVVNTLANGTALAYGTTYYVKIIAKDFDGPAGVSGQGSGSPKKVAAADSNLTAGDVGAPTTVDFNNLSGTVNTSIKSSVNEYAVNSSETVAPTTGWSTATPTRTPGTFIWFRTKVTYNNNNTSTTNPALLTGNTGAQGSQGVPGPSGDDGQSLYTWIKYADTPTTGMSDVPDGKTYLGVAYNKTTATESSVYTDYQWSLIKGADGTDGQDGIQGPPGPDGQPTYTWIKYSANADGTGLVDTPTASTIYIGIAYNKTTPTESTTKTDYEWSLFRGSQGPEGPAGPEGDPGKGITSVTPYFQLVNTGAAAPAKPTTATPSGWTTTEPDYVNGKELYRTEKILYTDNTFEYTLVSKVASYTAAQSAMVTANGKNKIITSEGDATGTVDAAGLPFVTGDIWFKKAGNLIKAQWEYVSGLGWVTKQLDNDVIANLNVGKLVSGDIDSAVITIKSTGEIKSGDYSGSAGWRISNAGGIELRKGTVYANTLESGTGIIKNLIIQTGGAIQSALYTVGSQGFRIDNTGIKMYDANSEVYAPALRGGTISGQVFTVGAGGKFIMDSTGEMKSNNYVAGSTGWRLYSNSAGNPAFELNSGTVKLETLTGGLIAGKTFELDTNGYIQTKNYNGTSGFRLSPSGLEIKTGTVEAAALKIQDGQNIAPAEYADFEYGDSYYINPFWNPRGQNKLWINTGAFDSTESPSASMFGRRHGGHTQFSGSGVMYGWFGTSETDYNVAVEPGQKYIFSMYFQNIGAAASWQMRVKGNNGVTFATSNAVAMSASSASYQRLQFVVTIPAGVTKVLLGYYTPTTTASKNVHMDGVQFERVIGGLEVASPWKPPATTTIDGAGIRSGFIRSTSNINVNGTDQPLWSINLNGAAQFGDASVRGKMIVGPPSGTDGGNSYIASGNYVANTSGWKIMDSGVAEFANITSRATNGTRTEITNATNPYESNQQWNMISMYSDNAAWSPAQIWANHLASNEYSNVSTGAATAAGVLQLAGPKLGSRKPAVIQLWSEEATNETRLSMNANLMTFDANTFLFGDTAGQGIVIKARYGGNDGSQKFSFRSPGNKRIDFDFDQLNLNQITSSNESNGTNKLVIRASDMEFQTTNTTGNLYIGPLDAANGRVGIGVPGNNLMLGYGGGANGVLNVYSQNGGAYQTIRAAAFTVSSDMREKTAVKEAKGGLETIRQLGVYDYTTPHGHPRKQSSKAKKFKQRGLSAQEIQKVMPDAVIEDDVDDKGLSVDIYYVVSTLAQALKEQDEMVLTLSKQVAELSAKLDSK